MAELLQHLVNGLVLGGTYALLGIGLTLIFGLMNVVNFAHGEFYTLGAYATFAALGLAGAPFFVAVLAAIACGAVVGALCELTLLRPLRAESIDTTMLVMILRARRCSCACFITSVICSTAVVRKSVSPPVPLIFVSWAFMSVAA